MAKFLVIKVSGKQYLVKNGDEILVDKLDVKVNEEIPLETLLSFDDEKISVQLGKPNIAVKTKAKIIEHLKGEKLNILKFKSKVRYTKRQGFRALLSKIKVISN